MSPVPPISTAPELEKEVPRNLRTAGEEGLKNSIPVLLTAPLLVKFAPNECVKAPPVNIAPFATVNVPATVQPRSGATPAVRSEEHTSELQSHSFISYAVF